MKARWLLGIMAAILAAAVTHAHADETDKDQGDDPDGSIALSEHFTTFAHQILRAKQLPQKALELDAALYRAAVKLNDQEPRFARALADVLMEMNDIPGAMDALKHYRDLDPADQTAQVQWIDLYLASDKLQSLDQRLSYLRYLLQVQGIPDPVKSEIALRAAQLRMQRGQQDEAMKLLDDARRLNPMNLKALRIRYVMTQDKALPVDRVTQLLGILQANPADPVVCSRLAEELAQLGLVDTAVLWYGQANGLYSGTGVRPDPVLREEPRQVAGARARHPGKLACGPCCCWIAYDGILHAMHSRVQMVSMGYPGRQRRISARAAQIDHQVSGNVRGDPRTELLPDYIQREIQSGGHSGAGKHRTVFDKDAIVQHTRTRLDFTELVDVREMRRAFPTGE